MASEYNKQVISGLIANIDAKINEQINAVLHHPRFQQLESSWRGLHYLVNQAADGYSKQVKLKVFNISWLNLSKDLMRATEFDQSQLFAKIYNNEFSHPGGEPFGLLIGDYYISHQNNFPTNDIDTLHSLTKIAAAAFVPFITSAASSLFGLDDFAELERGINLERLFQQMEYNVWKEFRQDEDSRFIGMVLPRVLMRLPYRGQQAIRYPFMFTETVTSAAHYLWGNAVYCYAAIVLRSFNKTGWFTEIRGLRVDSPAGQVPHLPVDRFAMDNSLLDIKAPVEISITDHLEKAIGDFGFMALSHCAKLNNLVLYGCTSVQKFKQSSSAAIADNRLSSMLHYILCVSRFSHYIKIIVRDKIGILTTPEECEKFLQNWLRQYTTSTANLSHELKAKYPLRDAKVNVRKRPGSLESYLCTIRISPHYQFDQVQAYLELTTEFLATTH